MKFEIQHKTASKYGTFEEFTISEGCVSAKRRQENCRRVPRPKAGMITKEVYHLERQPTPQTEKKKKNLVRGNSSLTITCTKEKSRNAKTAMFNHKIRLNTKNNSFGRIPSDRSRSKIKPRVFYAVPLQKNGRANISKYGQIQGMNKSGRHTGLLSAAQYIINPDNNAFPVASKGNIERVSDTVRTSKACGLERNASESEDLPFDELETRNENQRTPSSTAMRLCRRQSIPKPSRKILGTKKHITRATSVKSSSAEINLHCKAARKNNQTQHINENKHGPCDEVEQHMNNKKEPYSVGQYLQGKHEIKDFGTGEKSNDRINNLCFENYEYEKLEMVEKFHKIENLKNTKSNTEDVEDILFHISKQINPDSTSHNDKPSSSASFIKKGKRNAVTGGENSFNEGIDAEILNSSEFLEKMFGKANTGIRPLKKLDDVNEKSRDDMTSYNSVDSKEGGSHLSEDSNLVEHSYKQKNTLYTKSSIIKLTQTMDEQIETFFEKIGSMVDYYHDSFFAIFEPWLTHKKTAMNKGSAYMDNFQVGSVFNGFCFDYMDTFPDEFQNHSGYSLKDKRAELIRRGEFNNIMNKEKEEKENIKLQNFGFALCKSSAAFKNDYQTHKFVDTMYAKYNSFWFMLSNPFFDDSFYDVITCNPKLVYSTKNNQCIKEKSNENCTIKIQNEECFLRLLTRPLQTKLNFRAQIILEKVRLLRRKKLLHNGSLILQDAHSLWSSDLHRVSNSFKKSIAKLIIYGCVKEHDNDNGNKNKVEKEAPIAIPFVDKKEHYKMLVHKTRKFVIDPFIDASTVLLV